MEVVACSRCRRLFNYISGPKTCPNCLEAMEEEFQKVKKYIQENKGSTIGQVAEECEVSEKQIREWVRQERLEFAEGSNIGVNCEKCGQMIRSGRFCDKCKAAMTNSLNEVLESGKPKVEPKKKDPKDSPKMRFLN